MNALSESAGLFEVNFPDYKQLRACRREVSLLKQLWDMIEVVWSSIDEWKYTLWADINVENMEMECKRFVKEIRGLDKEMRAWDAFTGLDSTVKNMVTSLRAVGELQNPAIRDRHWQQLMQATKVSITISLSLLYRPFSNQLVVITKIQEGSLSGFCWDEQTSKLVMCNIKTREIREGRKDRNLLRWSLFTFFYNHSTNINYFT